MLGTSISRQQTLPAGAMLWRAQLGNEWDVEEDEGEKFEVPSPFNPDRMKPLTDRASEGRANPQGIPCLYTATCQATAIAEVRPWIGSYVSIVQFRLRRQVRVVDCMTNDKRLMAYASEPEPPERKREVWQDIDRAFSRPVTRSEDRADYAPTQVISEFFRENGLDGVAYGSSLGRGHNVALFDTQVADLVSCGLVEIRGIKLHFESAGNWYTVEPHEAKDAGESK